MGNELIPISDEQAKLLREALEVLRSVGGFVRGALGTVPEDLVGVLGGDWLKVRRVKNLAQMIEKARDRLERRQVTNSQEAELTLALPLYEAACNEGRDELQDLWARLLAAAMDPARSHQVRREFIDIVKQLEPLDAVVIEKLCQWEGTTVSNPTAQLASELGATNDEIDAARINLGKIGLHAPGSALSTIRSLRQRDYSCAR